ncbi:M16 family metallopeptidase [Sphingobacterium arenae]|uniref:Insulinase family protein n=1 Tax=Sphingobacterium arenae TaxID=1280598 RepID=A0ABR7Y605_9SPHI|nr:M16 family metallopeptidase [Sphingobacterium arenae]MBD1426739.1 insulinase family protein [Sphingobacterium arenae]
MNIKLSFFRIFVLFIGLSVVLPSAAQKNHSWKEAEAAGYTYRYVSNDPMNTRFYTLKNGFTVILTENTIEPRVTAQIAVRAGSNNDPATHTGLAHYLEHLLFKGTDKIGTSDWVSEKVLLDQIEELYETYTRETDVAKRRSIYKEIDRLSVEASRYSIANEYDKLMSTIGSQGTNAHTWFNETVYKEDIPSSSIDKFLMIQAERFRYPVFRLFHTELETVYEEKNMSIDNDGRRAFEVLLAKLFPKTNYGQQTTLGTVEHLKNPSLKVIRSFYDTYYVANNMAIVLAGDFNSDDMIKKVDHYFGSFPSGTPVSDSDVLEEPIQESAVLDVFGPSAQYMMMGYRVGKSSSREALLADVASSLLSNGKAGLIDLNLSQKQLVLGAGANVNQQKDYGFFTLYGYPKQGQSLEEVRSLLLEQIALLKSGEFDASLIDAIRANSTLSFLQGLDNNTARTQHLITDFIRTKSAGWDKEVGYLDALAKITKEDIVDFAKVFFNDNYVVINKKQGEAGDIVKVEKPSITSVNTNADKQSAYLNEIAAMPSLPVQPEWLDYKHDIQREKAGKAEVYYVQNKDNQLFRQTFLFEMGSWNDKLLPLAGNYLSYLGTDKMTAAQVQEAFYKLASNYSINIGTEETRITLTGLQENYSEAMLLFTDLLQNCKVDPVALDNLKKDILQQRQNNKTNKRNIMQGLMSYAAYGAENPFNDQLSTAELTAITGGDLVALLHNLLNYEHKVVAYSPLNLTQYTAELSRYHRSPESYNSIPAKRQYTRLDQTENIVLFADYDMVQADISWYRKGSDYQADKEASVALFNSYFGGGMGSIVFQNLREAKGLAYTTYARYSSPAKKEDPFAVSAFIGTQSDKISEAVAGMNALLNTLPRSEKAFDTAKKSFLSDIETQRIKKDVIIFSYLQNLKKGIDYDRRKDWYSQVKTMSFTDIEKVHQTELANKPYTYCIVASEKNITDEQLDHIGKLRKLSLEEIFGY